jgi:hypothetical protein
MTIGGYDQFRLFVQRVAIVQIPLYKVRVSVWFEITMVKTMEGHVANVEVFCGSEIRTLIIATCLQQCCWMNERICLSSSRNQFPSKLNPAQVSGNFFLYSLPSLSLRNPLILEHQTKTGLKKEIRLQQRQQQQNWFILESKWLILLNYIQFFHFKTIKQQETIKNRMISPFCVQFSTKNYIWCT